MILTSPIQLLVELVILGVIFYFVESIPMAAPFLTIIRIVAILVAIVLLLQFFGIAI